MKIFPLLLISGLVMGSAGLVWRLAPAKSKLLVRRVELIKEDRQQE